MSTTRAREEMRKNRGTLTTPGVNSPYRDRSVEENLDLFRAHEEGRVPGRLAACCAPRSTWPPPTCSCATPRSTASCTCHHHRTGDEWCIYPDVRLPAPAAGRHRGHQRTRCAPWSMRSTARCTTGSCAQAGFTAHPPRQIEFARLNITRTCRCPSATCAVWWKRAYVSGWDDPRMPTLAAMRRRGYHRRGRQGFHRPRGRGQGRFHRRGLACWSTACARTWATSRAARHGRAATRSRSTLTNWPEGRVDEIDMENHPDHPEMGTRTRALRQGSVHRARGLHGGAAEEVLPPRPRP